MKIFVCSTFEDFRAERAMVVDAIRELGLHPVNMEDFGSSTMPPLDICEAAVKASDATVVLIGPNYGSRVPDDGRSFVHVEICAAVEARLPMLVYHRGTVLRATPANWPASYTELILAVLTERTAAEIGAPRDFTGTVLRDLASLAEAAGAGAAASDWMHEGLCLIREGAFSTVRRRLFPGTSSRPGLAYRLLSYVEFLDDRDGNGIPDTVLMLSKAAAADDERASSALKAIAACAPGWL